MLTALVSVFGIVSIISVAVRPHASRPWIYREGDVVSVLARWIVSGVLSIVFDIFALALSVYMVWDLQTTSKSKSLIITAFVLRLFVAPVVVVRLVALRRLKHENVSFTYALPEAMAQLEMYCSVVSMTLPCLRLFLAAWNTSFIDLRLEEVDNDVYRQRKHFCSKFATELGLPNLTNWQMHRHQAEQGAKAPHPDLKVSVSTAPLAPPATRGRQVPAYRRPLWKQAIGLATTMRRVTTRKERLL